MAATTGARDSCINPVAADLQLLLTSPAAGQLETAIDEPLLGASTTDMLPGGFGAVPTAPPEQQLLLPSPAAAAAAAAVGANLISTQGNVMVQRKSYAYQNITQTPVPLAGTQVDLEISHRVGNMVAT